MNPIPPKAPPTIPATPIRARHRSLFFFTKLHGVVLTPNETFENVIFLISIPKLQSLFVDTCANHHLGRHSFGDQRDVVFRRLESMIHLTISIDDYCRH